MNVTTCTRCGGLYEAGSEEQANEPDRLCPTCAEFEKCVCGANLWCITATLIGCKACGKVWGRVNGQWVEETGHQYRTPHGKVNDGPLRLQPDGSLVVDRAIEVPVPVDFIPFNFVVPDPEEKS